MWPFLPIRKSKIRGNDYLFTLTAKLKSPLWMLVVRLSNKEDNDRLVNLAEELAAVGVFWSSMVVVVVVVVVVVISEFIAGNSEEDTICQTSSDRALQFPDVVVVAPSGLRHKSEISVRLNNAVEFCG